MGEGVDEGGDDEEEYGELVEETDGGRVDGVAVDGDILSSGKVLSTTDIAKLLNKEMQECNCIDRHEDTPCKCSSSNSSSCCCCNQNNSKIKLIIIALIILILGFIAMLLIG